MDPLFTAKLTAWTLAVAFLAFHLGRFWEIDKRLRRVLLVVVREQVAESEEYVAEKFSRAGERRVLQ